MLFYELYPLFVGILIAFSAGIFEEGFRFIFRKLLKKPMKFGIVEPIMFGLGHGVAEALFILFPVALLVPFKSLSLAIVERVLAIILHMGLTVIIWNGFQLNKIYQYLSVAILLHGLVNSLIPMLSSVQHGVMIIESALVIIDGLVIIYISKSKKYYRKEEKS